MTIKQDKSSGESKGKDGGEDAVVDLSRLEKRDVEEKLPTRAPVIFEIVRRMGEEELNRPFSALWWSGLAAGLSMGFFRFVPGSLKVYARRISRFNID